MIDMKRALLLLALVALAGAALLLPVRTTTPMLLSNESGTEWSCSTSALVFTTCAPNRGVRLASTH
jgi:hypothetical protein